MNNINKFKNSNWNYPTTVWFGCGRSSDVLSACKELKMKNPLLVTDPGLAKSPILNNVLESCPQQTKVFSDVRGNPVGNNIQNGVSTYKSGKHDGVIALGGGSGLDVGKLIAFMSGQNRPIWDFEDIGDYWTRANPDTIAPIIAIPTTAGTGSEVGRAAVVINEENQSKKIIFHPKILPSIVILDPELTVGLPPHLTAATGMDALAHNLEAYCALGFHPMADGIAIEGMHIIKNWLIEAVENGTNIEARSNMLVAASMGATAFQKGLGAIHSLSHPVNSVFNVHHGLSNAIFMPYVLTFNRSAIEAKISKLSGFLELPESSFDSFLEWVLDLRKKLKIPHTLTEEAKLSDSDIEKLSPMALEDPSTSGNPIPLTLADMKKLYRYSLDGKLF